MSTVPWPARVPVLACWCGEMCPACQQCQGLHRVPVLANCGGEMCPACQQCQGLHRVPVPANCGGKRCQACQQCQGLHRAPVPVDWIGVRCPACQQLPITKKRFVGNLFWPGTEQEISVGVRAVLVDVVKTGPRYSMALPRDCIGELRRRKARQWGDGRAALVGPCPTPYPSIFLISSVRQNRVCVRIIWRMYVCSVQK